MKPVSKLLERQRWMLSHILNGPKFNSNIEDHIMSTDLFPAQQRLAIYQDGYRLRLLECLENEFPILHLHLGEKIFRLFALSYLEQCPSKSYSLYLLGQNFPNFLRQTRPSALEKDTENISLALPEQIAALEYARSTSIRAKRNSHSHAVQPLVPHMLLSWPKLSLPTSSILFSTNFDLCSYFAKANRYLSSKNQEIKDIAPPAKPRSLNQDILIYRNQYRVQMMALDPWQKILFQTLADTETLDWPSIASQAGLSEADLLSKLNLWLPKAHASNQILIEA